MKSIISVLQDFEKLIYKILMWIILIPKTIVYVVLDPLDTPGYVEEELTEDKDSPFDEYMSPVVLLLVMAFLPALAFNFLPTFGSIITSPAETEIVTGRYVQFQSQTDFKAGSTDDSRYVHTWKVEKIAKDGTASEIYVEEHREDVAGVFLKKVDADTVTDQFVYNFGESGDYYVNITVAKVDSSHEDAPIETYAASVQVAIPPLETGQVTVSSANGKTTTRRATETGNFSERLKQEETIFLALALMIPPLLFAFASRFLLDKTKIAKRPAKAAGSNMMRVKATVEVAGDKLEESVTVPIQMKTPAEAKSEEKTPAAAKVPVEYVSIGEETLKQSFYVQCYFFSPLSLAIWGTIYASYFFTEDIFLYQKTSLYWQIILLPLVLCVMWFFRTEVKYFSLERKIDVKRAIAIAIGCVAVIGLGTNVIFSFEDFKDAFRVWMIRAFPIATTLLFAAFCYAWYQRRLKHKEPIISGNGAGILSVVLLFVVVMSLIPTVVRFATPSAAPAVVEQAQRTVAASELPTFEFAATAVVQANSGSTLTSTPQSTPTVVFAIPTATPVVAATTTPISGQPIPTQPTLPPDTSTPEPTFTSTPAAYYVEEFDGDLASWFEFMTSGDSRMVGRSLESGHLTVQLLQFEDKLPWYYLIRDGFSYSDVKVDALVTNRGNNTNGVSLICRYSDIGWYEFVISNSGSYGIYAVDNAGVMNQGYNLLADGSSVAITSGPGAVNVYTITCQGDKLDLSVNGMQVKTINEKIFKFADGKVGLAVSSPQRLPVRIEFESLTVSQP